MKALILTIGTEITSGEVVNSNAAWIGSQLERLGVRVQAHLSVMDQRADLIKALRWLEGDLIVVTGGLGPTTDDLTRECLSEFFAQPLEFHESAWQELARLYEKRELPLREAHRHQCYFPKGSERLANPAGTALGFYYKLRDSHYFALPGPPRELEAMWAAEVRPRLSKIVPPSEMEWRHWAFFAVPESEVAELVEQVIAGSGLEVGYRAHVPYVRVKLFVQPKKHQSILREMDQLLGPSQVSAHGNLAEDLLRLWPLDWLKISDDVSEGALAPRLFRSRHELLQKQAQTPRIRYATAGEDADFRVAMDGDGFRIELKAAGMQFSERRILPYKIPLDSERGRKYAIETALWLAVKALNSQRSM